jgi:hypothetical protein
MFYKTKTALFLMYATLCLFVTINRNAHALTPTPPLGWYVVSEFIATDTPFDVFRIQEWKNDVLAQHAWVALDANDNYVASGIVVATPGQVNSTVCPGSPGQLDAWQTSYFANGVKVLDQFACQNGPISVSFGWLIFTPPYMPVGAQFSFGFFTCYGAEDCALS